MVHRIELELNHVSRHASDTHRCKREVPIGTPHSDYMNSGSPMNQSKTRENQDANICEFRAHLEQTYLGIIEERLKVGFGRAKPSTYVHMNDDGLPPYFLE